MTHTFKQEGYRLEIERESSRLPGEVMNSTDRRLTMHYLSDQPFVGIRRIRRFSARIGAQAELVRDATLLAKSWQDEDESREHLVVLDAKMAHQAVGEALSAIPPATKLCGFRSHSGELRSLLEQPFLGAYVYIRSPEVIESIILRNLLSAYLLQRLCPSVESVMRWGFLQIQQTSSRLASEQLAEACQGLKLSLEAEQLQAVKGALEHWETSFPMLKDGKTPWHMATDGIQLAVFRDVQADRSLLEQSFCHMTDGDQLIEAGSVMCASDASQRTGRLGFIRRIDYLKDQTSLGSELEAVGSAVYLRL